MMTITQIYLSLKQKNYGEILFGLEKKYWKSDLGKQIENSFERLIKLPHFHLRKNMK